jgi:plasmid stability protein
MPRTLTLRNVPDALLGELRRRARRNGRSLQGELLCVVRQVTLDERSFVQQVERLRHRVPRRMRLDHIQKAIREGRP